MRPSNRAALLDAALHVMGDPDGGDITLDRVARAAGITKPGLMYHFPTREALMLAIVDHAAGCFAVAMEGVLGRPASQATPAERIGAYATVAAAGTDSRAEFAIFTESAYRPDLSAPWVGRVAPWFDLSDEPDPAVRARLTVARLAADGLWAAEATGVFPPDPGDREATLALIFSLTTERAQS